MGSIICITNEAIHSESQNTALVYQLILQSVKSHPYLQLNHQHVVEASYWTQTHIKTQYLQLKLKSEVAKYAYIFNPKKKHTFGG